MRDLPRVGDRWWSVRTANGKTGSGKNGRRFSAVPRLLSMRAEERDGVVLLTFPDGDGLDAFAEMAWVGRQVRLGTVVLHVTATSPRCVMVNAATADLPAQPGNLARHRGPSASPAVLSRRRGRRCGMRRS